MIPSRARIQIPRERVADFCRRNHIRRLALFGSVLRDDFTPESDVDVLVEFEPGTRVGFAFFDIQQELSQILGRRVDLRTPQELSQYFRDEVLAEAEEVYVAAWRHRSDAPHARPRSRSRRHGSRPDAP